MLGRDVEQLLHQVEHALMRNLALEVAAERRHDAGPLQRDAVLLVGADGLVRLLELSSIERC